MAEKVYQPGEPYQYPLILKKLLPTPLIASPDREIVYRDESRYSYTTFYERVQRLASGLEGLGVRPGDTVAILEYDSHRYLECYFAVPMMGAVMQTVNWRLSPEQILYTISHAEAKVILTSSDFVPLLERLRGGLDKIEAVVLISEEAGTGHGGLTIDAQYEDLLQSASASYEFPDLDEGTRATTFYTTGTTGNPKGVSFSHRHLVLHTLSVAVACGSYHTIGRFRSNDVYMPLTPMFHVHAWGFPYVSTLLGAKQVYPGRYEPERLLRLIRDEGVTFSHCVPTILQMLVSCPVAKEIDLSGWKVIIGGAQLPRGLAAAARKLGIEIHAGYGMSETCPVMTLATPKEHMLDWEEGKTLDVITRTGRPIPLAELRVVDAEGKPLPHDGASTGELVMRSPYLTERYSKDPEGTRELWRDGWLHSGDVGFADEDGYVQITDRRRDAIKSGGEWVSSLDLENLLSQHEAVRESAAIAVPDDKWGERPLMVVCLEPDHQGQVSGADLRIFMQRFADEGRLPKYAVPDRYELVTEIPKTSVGKLDKKALRATYVK